VLRFVRALTYDEADVAGTCSPICQTTSMGNYRMHLRERDWCERFGGGFSSVVKRFREALSEAEPLSADVAEHLREEFPEASRG
jgi:hypothetical protein